MNGAIRYDLGQQMVVLLYLGLRSMRFIISLMSSVLGFGWLVHAFLELNSYRAIILSPLPRRSFEGEQVVAVKHNLLLLIIQYKIERLLYKRHQLKINYVI